MGISEYISSFDDLPFNEKVELISKLVTRLNATDHDNNLSRRRNLLYDLFGAWEDTDAIDGDKIVNSRTISNKEINLD